MFSSQRNENVGDERSLKHPEPACVLYPANPNRPSNAVQGCIPSVFVQAGNALYPAELNRPANARL